MKLKFLLTAILAGILLYFLFVWQGDLWKSLRFLALLLCCLSLSQLWLARRYRIEAGTSREELLAKNQKLDAIFKYSALGIMLVDKDGKILDVNPTLASMLGYTKEDLVSSTFMDITCQEDAADDWAFFQKAIAAKSAYTKEKRYIKKNGDLLIAKLSAVYVLTEGGFTDYILANVEDITKEKQIEADLKDSKKRYRDLVAYSPEPILVHRGERIIFANEKACSLAGMSMEEALNKSIYDFISTENRDQAAASFKRLLENQGRSETRHFEIVIPDGSVLTIEITHKAIDYEGKPSIQAIFRDVTERRRLEMDLRKATERYQFLMEHSKDIIAFLEPDGCYNNISAASREILGYTQEELVGRNAFSMMHEEDAAEVLKELHEAEQDHRDDFSLLYRHKINNEGFVWIETVAKVLRNEDGMAESIVAISRDATKRKEKEKSLETANDFLKMLSSLDGLTGIPNRRYFEEELAEEWERNQSHSTPISAIMIDIDCFKKYNDTLGHLAGDDCLRKVAETLRENVKRTRDLAARYGGEEFIVLLPETDAEGARQVAENIRLAVRSLCISHPDSEADEFVTISAGYATLVPDPTCNVKDLLSKADSALYHAKRSGRNRVSAEVPPSPVKQ